MDFTTAITIFLKRSVETQSIPFEIKRDVPNQDTIDAMNEYYEMKKHPEKYKTYENVDELFEEVLGEV